MCIRDRGTRAAQRGRMHKTNTFLILSVVLAAAATPKVADAAACSATGMVASVKTFVNQSASCFDLRGDVSTCTINWQGWLYRPTGAVNGRPAIIYLHGHGDQGSSKGEPCELAKFFTSQGYV